MLSNARQRAKIKDIPFDLTLDDLIPLMLPCCPVLGIPLMLHAGGRRGPRDDSASLDRIHPEKGYVRGNVMIISGRANRIKSDATFAELQAVAGFYRNLK